ncbi:S8 family peptidase [Leifsonia sp. NPDC102414]|uniref:S8 family peptidase n=1 Tax=Leifsonia sp. NPDC102414 TaxID=3364124 RepID=UPI0038222CAA
MRHTPRWMLAAALSAAIVAIPTAAQADGSNWWYDYYSVADAHAAGWTGKGVTVAVIDGGINPELPVFDGADLTVDPAGICEAADGTPLPASSTDMAVSFHGSNVTAVIVGSGKGASGIRGIAPDADLRFYGMGNASGSPFLGEKSFGDAIDKAVADGAKIITTSVGWSGATNRAIQSVTNALAHGVIVLAAAPNSQLDTGPYPGKLNGVVLGSAYGRTGDIESDEHAKDEKAITPEATVVAPGDDLLLIGDRTTGDWNASVDGSGTSIATPIVAGILADVWQKYPKATSNQIIQSMIHNTTATDHPLLRDTEMGYGYGPISLGHLLRVDPRQYPDVNPLMDKKLGIPTAKELAATKADIAAGREPRSRKPSSFDGYAALDAHAAPSPLLWWVAGGVGALLLIAAAAVVVVIVTVRRRRRQTDGVDGTGGTA